VETVGGGGGGVVLLHAAIDFQGRPSCQAVFDVVLWFVVVRTLTGVASIVGTVGSRQLVQGVTGRLVVLFAAADGWSSGRLVRWSGRVVGCQLVVFVALVVVLALVVWLKGSCRVAALVSLVVFLVSMFAAVVVVAIQEVFVVVAAAIVVLVLAVVVFLAVLVVVRHQ
jgi:hypothetical protein